MHPLFEQALAAIEEAAAGLTPAVVARPVPGKWSIAGILEHLTLAYTLNRRTFEKALASGELRARRPTLPQRLGRLLVVDLGYFPAVEAPEATVPQGSVPPERSLAALRDALIALDETMARMSARFGDRVLVANHPYFAGLTIPQWRKFHWRHARHHMKQVRARR